MMELIKKYFPHLSAEQLEKFKALGPLYNDWNSKINVISRKDIGNLYERHVLHSLSIAEIINFKPSTRIMDLGTGGGFPGIPLAIIFPECKFHLIDGTRKKILVCGEIAKSLELGNVTTQWIRGEELRGEYDFVVARAVMPLADLTRVVRKNIRRAQRNAMPNGLICLKGGELQGETTQYKSRTEITDISDYFSEEYFKGKKIVYISL